jgi:rhodanese-related sulfurtransferase
MGFFSMMLGGNTISPKEARERMEKLDKYVLLDVRTKQEYKQIRIKGAKLIPLDQLQERAATDLPDKDVPILIYCQSGARAGSALRVLANMGYTDVVSFGGIMSWPYETAKG